MKKYLTFMILILILSLGAVCAADSNQTDEADILSADSKSFTDLEVDIAQSDDILDVKDDYTFDNKSDIGLVVIEKSNFTINGNNHILDGNRESGIFSITGNNVTINNLVFINGNSAKGGAI